MGLCRPEHSRGGSRGQDQGVWPGEKRGKTSALRQAAETLLVRWGVSRGWKDCGSQERKGFVNSRSALTARETTALGLPLMP